jgi:hypothetical protein
MPELNDELLKKAAHYRPSLILFHGPDAIQVIQECEKDQIELFGFDRFFIHNLDKQNHLLSTVQPSMADSFDYTSQGVDIPIADRYRHAIEFISKDDRINMYYEIVTRQDYIRFRNAL